MLISRPLSRVNPELLLRFLAVERDFLRFDQKVIEPKKRVSPAYLPGADSM
jgi:hypothetical protein